MNSARRSDARQSRARSDAWLLRSALLLCGALWLAAAAQFCALVALLVDANVYGARAQGALAAVCVIGAALAAWLALWLQTELRRARRRLRRAARRAAAARPTVRDAIATVPHVAPEAPPAGGRPSRTG